MVFGKKRLYSGKSGCIHAKVVAFGQSEYIQAKVVVFRQGGCNWAKVVIFLQNGCIRAKWLFSCKSGSKIGQNWLYLGKSGCIKAKVVVLGQ